MIDQHAAVDSAAVIGEGCVIERGAVLGAGVTVGKNVRIGPNVVCVSPEPSAATTPVCMKNHVRVGAQATIYAGVTLGEGCVVQPGAVVTRSVPPGAIVEGHPAFIVGYVDALLEGGLPGARGSSSLGASGVPESLDVKGVTLHRLPIIPDLRGNLSVGEFERQIPFLPRRYFLVFGVPTREVRGEHAHRECHQFLVCVRGSCSVVADDGSRRTEVLLDAPNIGLYLPPMVWGIQYKYSADALLLVFASHHYDAADYIRDYGKYLEAVRENSRKEQA